MQLEEAKVSLIPTFPSPPPPHSPLAPAMPLCARITSPQFSRTSVNQLVRATNEMIIGKQAKFSEFHSDLRRYVSC